MWTQTQAAPNTRRAGAPLKRGRPHTEGEGPQRRGWRWALRVLWTGQCWPVASAELVGGPFWETPS